MGILTELFFRFLKIGAFSFGGGYASLALLRTEVVEGTGWLTEEDFTSLCAIAEMTPGPVSLNAASFTGWQTAGMAGAMVATLGCILPSVCLVSLLVLFMHRYEKSLVLKKVLLSLRPVICAMVTYAAITMLF